MLSNMYCLLVLLSGYYLICSSETVSDKTPYSRGAIATLIRGSQKSDFADLILRNKSIMKNLYMPLSGDRNATRAQLRMKNLDIVCFYEEVTTAKLRKYIQAQTPDLPIIFKPVQFEGHMKYADSRNLSARLVYPQCHPTAVANVFKTNYRNMCRFWFIGFLDYVQEYDWVWRLDSDCEVLGDVRNILPIDFSHLSSSSASEAKPTLKRNSRPRIDGNIDVELFIDENGNEIEDSIQGEVCSVDYTGIFVSSPSWTPLDQQYYDEITPKGEGQVVTGLGTFTREFAARNGQLTSAPDQLIDSMYAPYTNSVFFNLKWLRGENYVAGYDTAAAVAAASSSAVSVGESHSALIRKFMKEVDESNCIYSNRW